MNAPDRVATVTAAEIHERWIVALDELEHLVVLQTAALDAHVDGVALDELSFRQPALVWPLPTALEARATALLDATVGLTERARSMSEELAPRNPVRHPRPAGRAAVSHFDLRA